MDRQFIVADQREAYYSKFPHYLLNDKVSHSAMVVYAALDSFLNRKTGQLNPGMETLAERAGCSRSRLSKYLKELEKVGCIIVERKRHAGNQYRLVDPEWTKTNNASGGALYKAPSGALNNAPGGATNIDESEPNELNQQIAVAADAAPPVAAVSGRKPPDPMTPLADQLARYLIDGAARRGLPPPELLWGRERRWFAATIRRRGFDVVRDVIDGWLDYRADVKDSGTLTFPMFYGAFERAWQKHVWPKSQRPQESSVYWDGMEFVRRGWHRDKETGKLTEDAKP